MERKEKQDKIINEILTDKAKKSKKKPKQSTNVQLPNTKAVPNLIGDIDPFDTIQSETKKDKKSNVKGVSQPAKSEKTEKSKIASKKEEVKPKTTKSDAKKVISDDFEGEVLTSYADVVKIPKKVEKSEKIEKNDTSNKKKKVKKPNDKKYDDDELVAQNSGSGVLTTIAPTEELSAKDTSGFTTVGEKKKKPSINDGWNVVGEKPTTSTIPSTGSGKRRSTVSSSKPKTLQKSSNLVYNPYNTEADFWNSELSTQQTLNDTTETEEVSTFPNFLESLVKKDTVVIKLFSQISSPSEQAWNSVQTSQESDATDGNTLDETEFPTFEPRRRRRSNNTSTVTEVA